MADDIIYKPHELYRSRIEKQVHEEATAFFEELVKKGEVDEAANGLHVKDYDKEVSNLNAGEKRTKKLKTGRVFVIISFFLVIGLFLIPLLISLNRKIKEQNSLNDKLKAKVKEKLDICYADLAKLNSLYDWNMPAAIMKKATPIIELDNNFTPERLCYLKEKFGMDECPDETASVVDVLSGRINGNPFILEKVFNEDTRMKTYEGSIVIHWTTTSRDSQGRTITQHHTQTLVATVEHPAPFYDYETRLIYGNEAAPDLRFSRSPSKAHTMDAKKRQKEAEKGAKELHKMAEKSLMKNPTGHVFTPMGNDQFDVFFGALDRDNEVQFRLLFTPLAQQNELDIITDPKPFGDDFYMVKDKMITSVASGHSQSFDYSANPEKFLHYDVTKSKELFVGYCDSFIRNLYYDLAPIISIPLYQMHKPTEYIYDNKYGTNITTHEHEVMANLLDKDYFMPPKADASLPLILKSKGGKKIEGGDIASIHSYSFKTTPMTDIVTKMGGDGKMHPIPVHWIKYDKVEVDVPMATAIVGGSSSSWKGLGTGGVYEKGLAAFASDNLGEEIKSAIKKYTK